MQGLNGKKNRLTGSREVILTKQVHGSNAVKASRPVGFEICFLVQPPFLPACSWEARG